jgi:hypothetical protein
MMSPIASLSVVLELWIILYTHLLRWRYESSLKQIGLDLLGWGQGPSMDVCEHSNEALGAIKGGEFFDQFSDYQLRAKDCSMQLVKNIVLHLT